jgi:hypothetical protein
MDSLSIYLDASVVISLFLPDTRYSTRAKWLQAAANIFDLIYKGSGEIRVTGKSDDPKAD